MDGKGCDGIEYRLCYDDVGSKILLDARCIKRPTGDLGQILFSLFEVFNRRSL